MSQPAEKGLLGWLDGPRLVVGAAVVFACVMLLFLVYLWDDQRQIQQERSVEAIAAKNDQVAGCFATANQQPALRDVLFALEREARSPESKQAIRNFRQLSTLNAPTLAECRLLARELNVPIPRGIR